MQRTALKKAAHLLLLICFTLHAASFPTQSSLAQSSEQTTIAILGLQPTIGKVEKDLIEGLTAYLAGQEGIKLTSAKAVSSFLTKQELRVNSKARANLRKAEVAYKKGKKAYEVLKVEEAISSFESALQLFDKSFPFMEDNRYLLMTHLYLGMSKILLKQKKQGRVSIRKMIVLDGKRRTRRLNKKFFPPDIIRIYEEIKRQVEARSRANLQVTASETGARVLIDGARVGTAPYKASELSEGEHTITVYKRGFERWSERVTLKKGENKFVAKLERAVPFKPVEKNNALLGVEPPIFKAAAKRLGADILLLADAKKLGDSDKRVVRAQLYSTAGGEFSKIETLSFTDRTRAKQRGFRLGKNILANLSDQGDVLPAGDLPPTRVVEKKDDFSALPKSNGELVEVAPKRRSSDLRIKKRPFYKSWWFWGALGGAALIGAGGVLVFTDTFKKDASNNVLVIDNPASN